MAKHGTATPEKVKAQQEAARLKAEQALTPTPAERAAAQAQEPTLQERLAAIDRRAREQAAAEKYQLAAHYVKEAQANFARLLTLSGDEKLMEAWTQWQDLQRMITTANSILATAGNAPAAASGGTRIRRSDEQLKAQAQEVIAYIKGKGKEGASGQDINSKFGKLLPSIKEFIKARGGVTLTSTGERAAMRYHVH